MTVKIRARVNRALTFAERKRLADFFMLLAHIDRRMTREAKKTRPRAQKQGFGTKKKTRLKYEDRKARQICGPLAILKIEAFPQLLHLCFPKLP